MKNRPLGSFFSCYKAFFAFGFCFTLCFALLLCSRAALSAVAPVAKTAEKTEPDPLVVRAAPERPSAPGEPGSWSVFHKDGKSTVSIYYPHLDNPRIDNELAAWADVRLRTFVSGVAALGEGTSHYSMNIDYTINQASPRYVSIVFRVSTDTGGLRPDLGLTTFSYDLNTGQRVGYKDIFKNCDGLFKFISEYAREDLSSRLSRWERELVERGTAPDESNFSYFSLVSDGLLIFFPPYQVASSSLGEQSITIPLDKLMPYGPNLQVWGQSAKE